MMKMYIYFTNKIMETTTNIENRLPGTRDIKYLTKIPTLYIKYLTKIYQYSSLSHCT